MKTDEVRALKHELRTPINHIVGYSELLLEAASELGERTIADQARTIHAKGCMLAKMIETSFLSAGGRIDEATMESLCRSILPTIQEIDQGSLASLESGSVDTYVADLESIRRAASRLVAVIDKKTSEARAFSARAGD